ncbi:DNA repair protein RecO, partial [bacterium]
MEASHDAIVLKRRDQGESDRRVTILTPDRGKIDAVAKGARKSASRLAAATEPLNQVRVTLATGKSARSGTAYMTQAEPRASRPGLRTDFTRLSAALSLVELYAAVVPYEEGEPEPYELLAASLDAVEIHPRPLVATLYCQVRLMELGGVQPSFGSCVVTGKPLDEREPFLSAMAGGYVSYA